MTVDRAEHDARLASWRAENRRSQGLPPLPPYEPANPPRAPLSPPVALAPAIVPLAPKPAPARLVLPTALDREFETVRSNALARIEAEPIAVVPKMAPSPQSWPPPSDLRPSRQPFLSLKAPRMSFLRSLFPTSKPTSVDAEAALARLQSDHRDALASIAKADAILRNLASLTDAEHASADAALLAGRRALARIEAQIAEIETARDAAKKAEASAAFFARRDGSDKLMAVAYLKAETKLRDAFVKAAEAAAEMNRIDEEVAAVNREIAAARKADKSAIAPALIPTSDDRYRSESDIVTLATTYEVERVCFDGTFGPVEVGYKQMRGDRVILNAGESLRTITKTNPEQRRPGRRLTSPTSGLVLPPTRIGEAPYWPPEGR